MRNMPGDMFTEITCSLGVGHKLHVLTTGPARPFATVDKKSIVLHDWSGASDWPEGCLDTIDVVIPHNLVDLLPQLAAVSVPYNNWLEGELIACLHTVDRVSSVFPDS
mmetsp:Transcript_34095/g.83827  ORF Transcript_34095/g.83827 Transcript_34095/m.83827 type:complete len:108 (+) Transcript_34095:450-773(+)